MSNTPHYERILVKLSGERLAGNREGAIFDMDQMSLLADEIIAVQKEGIEVAIVLGAGNIVRGKEIAKIGIEEAQAHQMGMLSIIINALAFQNVLEQKGADTRVLSAVHVHNMAEPYIRRRAMRHLQKGRIVIFAAGTGNPFFTSDTAGALRAIEMNADLLIKATKVDGIYTSDPMQDATAKHIPETTYKAVLVEDLQVMDGSAIALCREQKLPLMVCKVDEKGSLMAAINGTAKRTLVHA